jgi:sigma-E factor negative regulatory protein RseA
MKQHVQKSISALIDDELEVSELPELTRELATSEELRKLWGRYQLIGDAIRGERIDPGFLRLADRVRRTLADEPSVLAPGLSGEIRSHWLKPAAGLAIAASVAAGAVLLLSPQLPDPALRTPAPVAGVSGVREMAYPLRSGIGWDLGKPAVESKLNTYLVNHQRYAPAADMQGMLKYASFVGYDGGQ